MVKLTLLYGCPKDPAAFEDYYANRPLPFAQKNMPNVEIALIIFEIAFKGLSA